MITSLAIPLSSVDSSLVLDETPGQGYAIQVPAGEHLAVCFGQDARKPAARFAHRNLAAREPRLHEFKHYRPGGGKFWTARPGMDLWFLIPKSAIFLLPEKGYSYVKALIGEVPVTFNVSGGSSNGGWADHLTRLVHVSVGHSIRDLQRVAELATADSALCAELPLQAERQLQAELHVRLADKVLAAREIECFNQAVAASVVPAELAHRHAGGARVLQVKLAAGYQLDGEPRGVLRAISFHSRAVWRKPTSAERATNPTTARIGEHKPSKRARDYCVSLKGNRFRVLPSQIDWVRTASLNGIPVEGLL